MFDYIRDAIRRQVNGKEYVSAQHLADTLGADLQKWMEDTRTIAVVASLEQQGEKPFTCRHGIFWIPATLALIMAQEHDKEFAVFCHREVAAYIKENDIDFPALFAEFAKAEKN